MALRDKNGKFSPASAKALVQFRDSAMDFLIAKLEDAILSDSVAEILEKLGKPAVKPLIKILNGGSSKARNTAVETLGNIGDKVAVKPVIEVLGDKDKKLRFNAVEALGKIEDELAVKPLIAILRDSDRSVRLSAAEALISSDWSEKKDEICKSIIEVFEDDWVLAGLVIWSGCDSSEILHKSILELFNLSDNEDIIPIVFDEILLNYWKNVSVSKNFIRRSSGSYRVGGGVLDICKRKTTCRGSVNFTSKLFPTSIRRGKKCKEMTKGDLRLGVELPNPNNPQYLTTYYYCASCVSTYLNIQKRYDIMEKWWPQTLKAAQVANQRKIKEQETEQAAKKRTEKNKEIMKTLGPLTYLSEIFLESGDSEMKNLGLTIKKTGFSEEMLSTFLRLYLWDDDATIRNAARSVFFSNASKTLQAIVKKSWQVRYRTMATFNGPEPQRFVAGFPNRAKANAIEQFIKAINDSHGLRPTEYICVEAVLYPMLKSLTDQKTAYSGSLLFSGYNSDKYGIIPVVSANLKLLKKVEKEQIVNVASRIFARFMRPFEWRKLYGKNITIKTVELVACVAFYAACGLKGIKVTLAEISVHSKYSQAEISETYKLMKKKKNILNNDFPNVPIGWEW